MSRFSFTQSTLFRVGLGMAAAGAFFALNLKPSAPVSVAQADDNDDGEDDHSRDPIFQVGDPLPGLSPSLRALFNNGKQLFEHNFNATEGLGPIYNEVSCLTCHSAGATGGADPVGVGSTFNVTHFGQDRQGNFDPMRDRGGSVIQMRTIQTTTTPGCGMSGEVLPTESNVVSIRHTPPVFGFGLLDAIPDEDILKRENLGIDGIVGIANWGQELQAIDSEKIPGLPLSVYGAARVGRFGWKSQTATLFQFSAEPFNIELGVSTPFFPEEFTPQGLRFSHQLPQGCQVAATPVNDVDNSKSVGLFHFQALIAPPPRVVMDKDAKDGEKLFKRIGCDNCHVPELRTASRYNLLLADGNTTRVPQLENQKVHAYSDLLIHYMGQALSDNGGATVGRTMGRATGGYWRTTPLWGARFKKAYLHSGTTSSIGDAILQHAGEGKIVRDRFAGLPASDQAKVVKFINTL